MVLVVLEKLIAVVFSVLHINWLAVLGVTIGLGLTVIVCVLIAPGHEAAPIVAAFTTMTIESGSTVIFLILKTGTLNEVSEFSVESAVL